MSEKKKNNNYILSNNKLILNSEEFFLSYNDNTIYKIIIIQKGEEINIFSNEYFISYNLTDILSLFEYDFKNISKVYYFFLDLFKERQISIKNIKIEFEMQLEVNYELNNVEKRKIIILRNNSIETDDFNFMKIINKNIKLEEELSALKKENNLLKEKISKLKEDINNNKGPQNLKELAQITKDSYAHDVSDNSFTVFHSIHNYIFLIYSTKNKSIICYDLIEKKKIIEICNSHEDYITNLRHFLDKENKRDIVMSISYSDRNIKLWEVMGWECILDLKDIYPGGFIYSSAFLNYSNDNYIITSNYNYYNPPGFINVYNFNGKLLKQINSSKENTSYIDTYYDDIASTHYIITGNSNKVVAYNFEKNSIFKVYSDNYNNNHLSIIIHKSDGILKIIESCYDGNIRIWNFYTAALINKILISNNWLYGICIWDENYLFVGCSDKTIKLMELKDGFISKIFKGHNNSVLTLKKIKHPTYGECMISQGYNDDQIKIWANIDKKIKNK